MPSSSDITPLGGDLPLADRFLFELDGVQLGVFREVTGLQVSVNVKEMREGGQNGYVHQLPGRMTWPHLVFRRGVTDSNALFDWFNKTSGEGFASNDNKLTKSTGAVTVIDTLGHRLRSWEFIDVFPVRWSGPDLSLTRMAPNDSSQDKLWGWFMDIRDKGLTGDRSNNRKNGSIVLYNTSNDEVGRFNFINAWPSKIATDAVSTDSNEPLKETITLVCERLDRVK
jgi:phage tail-like protein